MAEIPQVKISTNQNPDKLKSQEIEINKDK